MIQVDVLGPVEAAREGSPVGLGGPKPRTVLGLLVAGGGRPVPVDALIDALWGERAGRGSRASLQTYVSNLRGVLGEDVIVWDGDGYRLRLSRDAVDAWRFEDAIEAARRVMPTDPAAATQLREALALWRGRPYAGLEATERLEVEARRLEELRLGAVEDRIDAELEVGAPTELAAELAALTREHPMRERLRGQHMLALYRSGRQAEALAVYDRTRAHLTEEIGVEPSAGLRELHRRMLAQDPSLMVAPWPPATAPPAALPSGIVTFVLTDIEGSTRLFHRLGDRYADILERHREILRGSWAVHGGHETSVEGDGSCVAFATATAAVRACADAQRALAAETWPDGAEVRVRMGVQTGLASPQNGDYVALALHEAARVMAAAHGGQILLSQRTVDELGTRDDHDLRPLGRFRLTGFREPVRLYELRGTGLADDFPMVRAVRADGHNLIRHPTETVGREELVASVAERLQPGRLVTLVGPGGVGKTRVATEIGTAVADRWEGGAWLVDLTAVTEPGLVAAAVADAVGAPVRPSGDRWKDVVDHLATRRAVVILDNCEHVVGACRDLADALFVACRGVAVLATSREPLYRPGEVLAPVEPLGVPTGEHLSPADVLSTPAGWLFAQRGSAVRPGFTIDGSNAAAVAAICRHLDGLPLLIELAAALLPVQSPVEILAGLERRPGALRSRDPRSPDRHGSVEGLIGWSYRLLEGPQREAFRRLSVFGAGFSLEMAEAAVATGGVDGAEVPDLVWSLVERSLVAADLTANDTRYRMLGIVRSFGRGLLEDEGEAGAVAVRLARAFLERLGPWLPTDRGWVARAATEVDNLRALIPLVPSEDEELAQQLACTIGRYHDVSQSFRDGVRELSRYADTLEQPSPARVSLLAQLADLHLRNGEVPAADALVGEARALRDQHDPPQWDDVAVDRARGEIARRSGDLEGAVAIARTALERPLSDRGRSRMYNLLGTTLAAMGDLDAAYDACASELELNRRLGYEDRIASGLGNLAETALRLGDLPRAAEHQRSCLELAVAQGSPALVAFSLIVAARLAGYDGEWSTAVRLHARAEVMLEETGLSLYEDDRRESDQLLADARRALGDPAFDRALDAGRQLPTGEAVQLAEGVLSDAEARTAVAPTV